MQDINLLEIATRLSALNGTQQGAWLLGVCQATLAKEASEIVPPTEKELSVKNGDGR